MKTFIVESPAFPGHDAFNYARLLKVLESANVVNQLEEIPTLDVDITEREGKVFIETDSLDDLVKYSSILGGVMALEEESEKKEFAESLNDD